MRKIQALKDEAVPIINFRTNNYDVGEFYKNDKLLRNSDYIKLLNCLFVRDVLTNFRIPPFQKYFIKPENLNQYNTRNAKKHSVILTQRNNDFYGKKSIQSKELQELRSNLIST